MSVPWQKRLRKLVEGQEWVKGAVNYDEDLHFSSYYLSASCSRATAPLYPGYSSVIASYEGFNETYFLLKQECRDSAAAIVAKSLKEPRWLPRILREIRRRSDSLAGIFHQDTSPALLARLSDAALLALYRRHDARHRSLYKFARLPEALDRGDSYFTDYLLGHLRGRGLGATACAEAFAVLSQPVVPSVLAQEILEFDDLVRYARSQSAAMPFSSDGPARVRMGLDPELMQRLDTHRQRWQYLCYHGYGKRELTTLNQYIDRLMQQSRDPGALADTINLLPRCQEAERARRQLLERLTMDLPHRALFQLYPEIGAVKLYRRYAQVRNFYFLDMLLAEIARRLSVSEWTIRCMLPQEVFASLQSGRPAGPAIRERLGGCVYTLLDGREQILTGEQAAEVREMFRPKPSRGRASNVLHGVVACRGKAAGPCKVIIRADDVRGGFEKGTIVVSESTDPDLVRFLRAAGGVLTEQGGVTSHAAVICRELGVPTIIGVEGLLERVQDGDWVEMDAELGTITLTESRTRPKTDKQALLLSPDVIGAKAYNLGVVRSLGFRVPDFVLLDYDDVRRAAGGPARRLRRQLVERLLTELGVSNGDKMAVRSSSVLEDRDNGSGAGEFRSLLNVGRDELDAALREFVKSNRRRNGKAYQGSVIVQRMVHADCAGVCLTREARTRHGDAVILEMAAGGNESVTAGTVRPDRIVVDRLTGDILNEERRCAKLREGSIDVAALVRQFLTLETRFGKPLDIEWALADRELYILQARPIVNGLRRAAGIGPVPRNEL